MGVCTTFGWISHLTNFPEWYPMVNDNGWYYTILVTSFCNSICHMESWDSSAIPNPLGLSHFICWPMLCRIVPGSILLKGFNSSPRSAAYMHRWNGSTLIQIWKFNENTKLFIHEIAFENIVCEMAALLRSYPTHLPLDKIAAIWQTMYADAFSWMKVLYFD